MFNSAQRQKVVVHVLELLYTSTLQHFRGEYYTMSLRYFYMTVGVTRDFADKPFTPTSG